VSPARSRPLPQFRRGVPRKPAVTRHPIRVLIPAVLCLFVLAGFASIALAQSPKEPNMVILKGSPMGGVKFDHKAHAKDRGIKCETCHHPSKPEKALKAPQEKCTDCHTKVAAAPMKTKTQAAFHDPMAKKGLCADCHQETAAKGKAKKPVPAKCADCHKKENA
jgi:hypothetical protein